MTLSSYIIHKEYLTTESKNRIRIQTAPFYLKRFQRYGVENVQLFWPTLYRGSFYWGTLYVNSHASECNQLPSQRISSSYSVIWRLGSRVVSVLDSGAEGPGFKSQPRRYRATVLGKLFTSIVPLFTKQRNC